MEIERGELGAETPDVLGPESEVGTEGAYETKADAAFGGDDSMTPDPLEDLADSSIADAVGPGALAEPVGPETAHQLALARQEDLETAESGVGVRLGQSADPDELPLERDIHVLKKDTKRLARDDDQLDSDDGGYWADLRTGRIESEPDDGVYSRIGPFHTVADARAAIEQAHADSGYLERHS